MQLSCISQLGAVWKPPRKKHRDGLLVLTVALTELGNKISLLKVRTENNPCGPKHVEKQPIRTHVRDRPDENDHEKIERVPDPEIWTTKDEVWWSELFTA
jgi:hypothetical protein